MKRIKFICVYDRDFMWVWNDGSFHRFGDDGTCWGDDDGDDEKADPQWWRDTGWEHIIEIQS